jgi:hypothetical protein
VAEKPQYVLTFEALPAEQPDWLRLKNLLKVALRRFRLRCTGVEEVRPTPTVGVDDEGRPAAKEE